MSVLAALADGSLPRLSQVVARLERRGLVRRHPDPDDGRYTLATLTDAGRAVVTEGHRPRRDGQEPRLRPVGEGQGPPAARIRLRILTAIDPSDRCFDHLR